MMQDRFKFRVWNKLANTMTYNFMFGNYMQISKVDYEKKYWVGVNYEPEYICFENEGIKNIEIMQCTGLKDKNGKLIFEGDIVEVINCRGANAIVEYNTERAKFKLNGKKFSPSALEYIRNDYFEVIGNVYENLELLEDK